MTTKEKQKLAQLMRRLKAAQAEYKATEREANRLAARIKKAGDLILGVGIRGAKGEREKRLQATYARDTKALAKADEQLKELEEKIESLKENMGKAKAKNPRGKHLPKASAKYQRMYEDVLKSAKASGRYKGREKEVAARTVRAAQARAKKNPRYTVTGTRRNEVLGSLEEKSKAKATKRARQIYTHAGYVGIKATQNPKRPVKKWTQGPIWNAVMDLVRSGYSKSEVVAMMKSSGFPAKDITRAEAIYTTAKHHVEYGQNPKRRKNASAKSTLRKAGRAAKGAVRKTLDAGSKLLKAGVKALKNPDKAEHLRWAERLRAQLRADKKRVSDYKAAMRAYKQDHNQSGYRDAVQGYNQLMREIAMLKKAIAERVRLAKRSGNPRKRIKVRNTYIDLVIKGQAKKTPHGWKVGRKTIEQGRGTAKLSSGYYLDKATGAVYAKRQRNIAGFKDAAGQFHPIRSGMEATTRGLRKSRKPYRPSAVGEKSTYSARKAAKRGAQSTRLKKSVAARKATTGRLAGRALRKSAGVLRRGRKNPSYTVEAEPKYTRTIKQDVKALTRGSAIRKVRRTVPGPKNIYKYSVTKNPSRKKNQYTAASRALIEDVESKFQSGATRAEVYKWLRRQYYTPAQARKYIRLGAPSKRRRSARGRTYNPSARSIRKKFAGRVSGSKDLYFPQGAPQGMAKLGKLVSVKFKGGKKLSLARKNPSGEVWLCSDTRGKLWLGSTVQRPLYSGPAEDFGEVREIEYAESKPHLGYARNTTFFHHMGEEGGRKPHLHSDGQGGLVFRGGSYRIRREGIVN